MVAQALADLGGPQRDPGLMWRLNEQPTFKCSCSTSCNDKVRREKEFEATLPDAQSAILCSDGVDIPSDIASARTFFEDFSKESEWADLWSNIRLGCSGWPKAKKGFQGPVEGNTSFPILFIGNTAGTSFAPLFYPGVLMINNAAHIFISRPCYTSDSVRLHYHVLHISF